MEKFEKEYRQMIQEDMPDLWGRIEAGLKEKESSMELTGEATKAAGKSAGTGTGEQEKTGDRPGIWEMPEKRRGVFISGWKRYAVTAASGLCVLLMIPAVLFSISSKSSGTGENSSSAQVETDGMYASGMEGAAFNAAESETAESETSASESGASADSGAEENKAWESTEQGTEDAAGISAERETGEMGAESAAGESTPNEGEMKSLYMEDGTVIGQVQVIVLEADRMQYHTVYRVVVEKDDSGLLAEGLELRILSENGVELAEGEAYQITVLYSEEASVPFRLADWKKVVQSE